jgi:hypothetical protein
MDFRIFNKLFCFNCYQEDVIIGIGSKSIFNNHILHLDLDDQNEQRSKNIIINIQNKYSLNTALLLKSSDNNYHAVFFDLLPFDLMIKIQKEVNFKHGCMSELKGESTIRLSSKFGNIIKPIRIIENKGFRFCSLGHFNAFVNHFKLDPDMFNLLKFKKGTKKVNIFIYSKRLKLW